MPAFEKTHDGDAVLCYAWEDDVDDESLWWKVEFRGPITEAMTQDEDAIPSGVMRGSRLFVLKSIEYVNRRMDESQAWLERWCERAGTSVGYFLDWLFEDEDSLFYFGSDDGPYLFSDERSEVIKHAEKLRGKRVPAIKQVTDNYRCAC